MEIRLTALLEFPQKINQREQVEHTNASRTQFSHGRMSTFGPTREGVGMLCEAMEFSFSPQLGIWVSHQQFSILCLSPYTRDRVSLPIIKQPLSCISTSKVVHPSHRFVAENWPIVKLLSY
jgi:hypothetical protein